MFHIPVVILAISSNLRATGRYVVMVEEGYSFGIGGLDRANEIGATTRDISLRSDSDTDDGF